MQRISLSSFIQCAVLLLLYSGVSHGQNSARTHECGTDFMMQQLFSQHPESETQFMAYTGNMPARKSERSASPPTYIIPVVFHVLHDYGTENISDAQILDAMAIMNRDYRKLNADTSQIVPPFDTIAADCEIEFRLAQLDPNGNCTNGIDRIATMETYIGDDGSKLNQWPRNMYLNIWVVKNTYPGIWGYTYFPYVVDGATMAPRDGLIMLHDYIGSIGTGAVFRSRLLIHEIGHWLGLQHLKGNAPVGQCGDDGLADTPVTKGWSICQLVNNDVCTAGVPENVQNFMDGYCHRMFTRDQRDFMHAVLNDTISERSKLWSNFNLIATGVLDTAITCIPHADFKSNRRMICKGGNATLTDQSWSNSATSHQWNISGPVTMVSSAANPLFVFNTPGWYDVSLIATNSAGSDTLVRQQYLYVSNDTATFTSVYSEGFESPSAFNAGYISNDRYGNGSWFTHNTTVGHTGTSCAQLNSFGSSVNGDIDELITPAYDLRFNTGLQLSFVYAYATTDTAFGGNTQILKLWSSIDCGNTWTMRWTGTGPMIESAGLLQSSFVPSGSADWDTVVVNLPWILAQDNVRFKFEFTSPQDGYANNLYIDDINILSTNVGVHENSNGAAFSVYPNPSDGNSMINYTLTEQSLVTAELYDLSGRLVRTVCSGEQSAGNYSQPVNEDERLSPGTYFIRMQIGENTTTQTLIVLDNG